MLALLLLLLLLLISVCCRCYCYCYCCYGCQWRRMLALLSSLSLFVVVVIVVVATVANGSTNALMMTFSFKIHHQVSVRLLVQRFKNVMTIYNAVLAHRRVLFLGHNQPAGTASTSCQGWMVLSLSPSLSLFVGRGDEGSDAES